MSQKYAANVLAVKNAREVQSPEQSLRFQSSMGKWKIQAKTSRWKN